MGDDAVEVAERQAVPGGAMLVDEHAQLAVAVAAQANSFKETETRSMSCSIVAFEVAQITRTSTSRCVFDPTGRMIP